MVGIGNIDDAFLLLAILEEKKGEVEDCETLRGQVLCK